MISEKAAEVIIEDARANPETAPDRSSASGSWAG